MGGKITLSSLSFDGALSKAMEVDISKIKKSRKDTGLKNCANKKKDGKAGKN